MVNIQQFIFSLFVSRLPTQDSHVDSHNAKSILIVGAGSAGLAMLKTLLDLPDEIGILFCTNNGETSGGSDPHPVSPPELPETPLYPLLHTNTPVPSMTYPGFPFPPGTPLYPSHEHIEAYHQRYAWHFNLTQHIRFNHTVVASSWTAGRWHITFHDHKGQTRHKVFDHLVVASGHNNIPHIPVWRGQKEWLGNIPAKGLKREILHSIWYREPQKYANRSVVVVGSGASGRDAASQISSIAQKTYLSARGDLDPARGPIPNNVVLKPEISYFTPDAVVFRDGTNSDADSVLLGTGYELRIPFLDEGNTLVTDPSAHSNVTHARGLVTNLRYLFPLHKHVLSLSPSYPPNALAFIGLPIFVANCPSDIAQSLFAAHAIVNPNLLPPRNELLAELAIYEQELREKGYDPYYVGHRLLDGSSSDYQDDLVRYLKKQGAIPDDGKEFVESWRREVLNHTFLKRGWLRVEELGIEEEWTKGLETEEEWADLMRRLNDWQADWEKQEGIPFVDDWDLRG